MNVTTINNDVNMTFKSLTITDEALAIFKKEKGALKKIAQYKKELKNSVVDIHVSTWQNPYSKEVKLWYEFGSDKEAFLRPFRIQDDVIGIYSHNKNDDESEEIEEYLQFSSIDKAIEVYKKWQEMDRNPKTPLEKLETNVFLVKSMKDATRLKDAPWYKKPADGKPVFQEIDTRFIKKPNVGEKLRISWVDLMNRLQ